MNISRVLKVGEHTNTILTNLGTQRELKELCDVIIKVKDCVFYAHRNVLAAGSDHFHRIFTTEIKEKYQRTVTIGDVTPGAVKKVFDFLYSGEIEVSTNNVTDVVHAASVMQVPDLLDAINEFLTEVVNPLNCLDFREIGRFYSLDKLTNVSHRCILDNFEKVSKQAEFAKLSLVYLEEILASDDLIVASESIVFEALMIWTRQLMDERKHLFPRLFKNIRLQKMSSEYLSAEVSKEPLVREFHVCRDIVDEAFRFHLSLNRRNDQRARKGQRTDIHSVALFSNSNYLHIFNTESKQWSYINHQNMVAPSGSIVTFYEDEIYIFPADNSNSFHVYANGNWRNETAIPSRRDYAEAAVVEGNLYLIGGIDMNQNAIHNDVLVYDFNNKSWTYVCNLQTGRFAMGVVVYRNEIYNLGGYTDVGKTTASCAVETLDTESKILTPKSNMNTERAMFGTVLFGDRIYAFGGIGNNGTVLTSVEFMDIEESVWTNFTTDIPVELGANSACCVGNRVVLLGKENVLLSFDTCTSTWRTESQVLPSVQGAKLVPLPCNDEER